MSLVVEKTFRLVDLVAQGHETLAELTRGSGLSRSTAHRLLSSLVEHGYLSYDVRRYELGYRLLELGEKKKRSLRFLDGIRPTLRKYADITLDTIHVAMLDGTDIVLIECVPGQRQLQIRSFVGQRAPAFSTAVGKALIGRQPPENWPGFLRSIPQSYPRSYAELMADFENARRRNIGIDRDEISVGTCGIASAFKVNEGLYAAVSINGATVYFPPQRLQGLADTACRAADEIEEIVASQMRHAAFPGAPGAASSGA